MRFMVNFEQYCVPGPDEKDRRKHVYMFNFRVYKFWRQENAELMPL